MRRSPKSYRLESSIRAGFDFDEEKNVEKDQVQADDSGGGVDDSDRIKSENIPCVYGQGRHVSVAMA